MIMVVIASRLSRRRNPCRLSLRPPMIAGTTATAIAAHHLKTRPSPTSSAMTGAMMIPATVARTSRLIHRKKTSREFLQFKTICEFWWLKTTSALRNSS
jgi:hypothetical protein